MMAMAIDVNETPSSNKGNAPEMMKALVVEHSNGDISPSSDNESTDNGANTQDSESDSDDTNDDDSDPNREEN